MSSNLFNRQFIFEFIGWLCVSVVIIGLVVFSLWPMFNNIAKQNEENLKTYEKVHVKSIKKR